MSTPVNRARAIFLEAIEQPDAAARVRLIAHACRGDVGLQLRVERLLEAHEQLGSFHDQSPSPAATIDQVLEHPGTQIGPYHLLQQIGEGGMGVVFMAEQVEPVKRRVALKVIKPGMDTRPVIARFEAERQALSLMDHPNIAKVLDAGTTESGRPYFVMELVKGQPITHYCDEHHLTPRQRLELFIPVCYAIQHAHQRGIIHRDIKPTNILVAEYDNEPVPKVIDFGVAKATSQLLTEKSMFTSFGQIVGTLEYMSPEQAQGHLHHVDTRSDIYALGVVLYELLAGNTPFDKELLRSAGWEEMLRFIREEELPRPSKRLVSSSKGPSIAANRSMDCSHLQRTIRGELDWIVMKSLEKDRNRRYETVSGLAQDLQRYLADEPVLACPPSSLYRLRKFAGRNKGTVLAAALVVLTLVIGISGTTWGMLRAEQARSRAEAAKEAEVQRAKGERRAKNEVQRRLAQLEKGSEILASVFENLNPLVAEAEGVPSRDLLCERICLAARQLEGDEVGDPLVVARLQHVLGNSLFELGYRDQAERLLSRAVQTRQRLLGKDDLDTVTTKHHLAMLYRELLRYAEAESLYHDVLRVRAARLGPDHLQTMETKHHLAMVYFSLRKLGEAEALLREVLAIRVRQLGSDHPDTLITRHRLAIVYRHQEKYELSESLQQQVLDVRMATLGSSHLDTIATKGSLAAIYHVQGKHDLAEPLYRDVIAVRTAKLGAEHPDTLSASHQLAGLYQQQGQFSKAETLYQQVLDARTARLGPTDLRTIDVLGDLATLYCWKGELARAEEAYADLLQRCTSAAHVDRVRTLTIKAELAALYLADGQHDQAESLYAEVVPMCCEQFGEEHLYTLKHRQKLGEVYQHQGKYQLAESQFQSVLENCQKVFGPGHHDTILARDSLANALRQMKRFDLVIPLLEETLSVRRGVLGGEDAETLGRQVTLGANYCEAGRFDEGLALIEEVRHMEQPDPHPAWVRSMLLTAYLQAGRTSEAVTLVAERVADARQEFPAASAELAAALGQNGQLLLDAKAHANAESLLLESYEYFQRAKDPRQSEAKERLVSLYLAWGKPEELHRWQSEQVGP